MRVLVEGCPPVPHGSEHGIARQRRAQQKVLGPNAHRGFGGRQHDSARAGIRPVVMRPSGVAYLGAAAHQPGQLLGELRNVEKLDLPRVQPRLQRLIEARRRYRRDAIGDPVLGEVVLESQPGVGVADDRRQAVAPDHACELANRLGAG